VALYLAQHTGRRYDTLFSDEADGPLDPERKRMFMAMKREVLKLGVMPAVLRIAARSSSCRRRRELTAMAEGAVIDHWMGRSRGNGTSAGGPARPAARRGQHKGGRAVGFSPTWRPFLWMEGASRPDGADWPLGVEHGT
jgi:exonuclease SbcC